jgi:uncharacterized protein YkwD
MKTSILRTFVRTQTVPTALLVLFACALTLVRTGAQGTPIPQAGPTPQAPPPAPPVEVRSTKPVSGTPPAKPKGLILYSIGQPTDEEQLYLEYINRSRSNPTAEGVRLATTTDPNVLSPYAYFGVNLSLMQYEFSTNPAVPPLAMNAQLLAAARLHSGDMFANQYQGHAGTDGSTPGTRITAQGYSWYTYGENAFAYSRYTFYGHAAMNVDWGSGVGGMQTPPGHRNNIHNGSFREAGIGVVDGINGSVGPQIVTQDLATHVSAEPLVTGVVYYDLHRENFYDVGEGIGGVTVTVSGSTYYAVTADSGGYAVPVPGSGNYTVTFTAPGLTTIQRLVTVSNLNNLKADYVPVYSPPVISGPNPASVNLSNLYTFSAVGAATGYQWQQAQLSPYTAVEGAENGLGNVTVAYSSNHYSVITRDLVASGRYSFHLAHPRDPSNATDQYLTFNAVLRPGTTSQLTFAKLLGWATASEVARAQVSTNAGASWQDIWSQAGREGSHESTFSTITVSLSSYAGQIIQVRFVYNIAGNSFDPRTNTGVGLYLDDIAIHGADQVVDQIIHSIPANPSFTFYPTSASNYLLQVRAQINSRTLNWGPALFVSASTPPPVIQLAGKPTVSSSQFQVDFVVTNYRTGMTFQLWRAPNPNGIWAQDTSAFFETLVPNSRFRTSTTTGTAPKMFYRVLGSYSP